MSEAKRALIIEKFNDKEDLTYEVILCPYNTASVGIDLIGASYVYLFEPAINIATEWQAIFRVVRVGQMQEVTVTRLFTTNTFDGYRENRNTVKIIPELAMYSSHHLMTNMMQELVHDALDLGDDIDPSDVELDSANLALAARLVIQRMLGQQTSRETDTPHIKYHLVGRKRTADEAGLIDYE